ncbi:hypothetical protein QUF56_12160 [Ureibacillus composti]|nr:hypothetical protein [Ureibacillus composti]
MTTIQLVDTNVILMEKDIIERYEVGYILRNGANLTIIKQFKGERYRKVIYLDQEGITMEQRRTGDFIRYVFVGEWFATKAPLFGKKNYRYNKSRDFKHLCDKVEKKLSEAHNFEEDIFRMLTGTVR